MRPSTARPGRVRQFDAGGAALLNPGQVLLVDVDHQPEGAEIGDVHQRLARRDLLPLGHVLARDGAGGRRVERQRPLGRARGRQPLDLLVRDVPVREPALSRPDEPLGAALFRAEPLGVAKRRQVLFLGGDELRAVDGKKRIARLHAGAFVIDVQRLDPAADLGRDGVHPLLVRLEAPRRADRAAERLDGGLSRAHADVLQRHR